MFNTFSISPLSLEVIVYMLIHVCNLWSLGQKEPLRLLKDALAIEIFDEMYKRGMILTA